MKLTDLWNLSIFLRSIVNQVKFHHNETCRLTILLFKLFVEENLLFTNMKIDRFYSTVDSLIH